MMDEGIFDKARQKAGNLKNVLIVTNYTMLTINADDHPLMRMFHKPVDKKRMVVILQPERYQDWLRAAPEHSLAFMRPLPVESLQAMPAID